MKNLLYKEIVLCVPIQTWILCALSITIVIPSYPSLVAFFYPLASFISVFTISSGNRDLLYSASLPIRKSDVVKGRVLLLVFLEICSILISIPFGVIKNVLLEGMSVDYTDLGVNLVTYAIVLFIYGLFNLIAIPWWYKKPSVKNVWPFISADIAALPIISCSIAIFAIYPEAATLVNSYEGNGLLVQLLSLIGGLIAFFAMSALSYLLGAKTFKKVGI